MSNKKHRFRKTLKWRIKNLEKLLQTSMERVPMFGGVDTALIGKNSETISIFKKIDGTLIHEEGKILNSEDILMVSEFILEIYNQRLEAHPDYIKLIENQNQNKYDTK